MNGRHPYAHGSGPRSSFPSQDADLRFQIHAETVQDLQLPSSVHRAAESAYHAREWRDAERIAKASIKLEKKHVPSWVILFKSQVRLERFEEAEKTLSIMEQYKLRDKNYLSGFLNWKRGDLDAAISDFKRSIKMGYKPVAVHRDLAHCLNAFTRTI